MRFLIAVCTTLTLMHAAAGQWTPVLEDGGNVFTFALDPDHPNTLYAAGWGVFKSTDGGETWGTANTGLPPGHIRELAIDPANTATIYAGHYGQGVFKSLNGGATWSYVGLHGYVLWLAADQHNPRLLYAVTDQGLFRTEDAGRSWTAANAASGAFMPECCAAILSSLAVDPSVEAVLYAGTANYYDGGGSLFKSTDGGRSWTDLWAAAGSREEVNVIAIDPTDSRRIFAGTDGGLRFSSDGGDSWTDLDAPLTGIRSIAFDPADSATIYAGTSSSGILKSEDGGVTWSPLSMSGIEGGAVTSLIIEPDHILALVWGAGFSLRGTSVPPR